MANAQPITQPETPAAPQENPTVAAKIIAAEKAKEKMLAAAAKLDASMDPALVALRDEAVAEGKAAFITGNAVRVDA